jgi:predicted DNA-binding ribbon-helix-helix protein
MVERKSKRLGGAMTSLVLKRSIVVGGRKTSVSLEDLFWKSLREIASGGDMTLSALLAAIDSKRHHANLSSAIRLFVLNYYREQLGNQLDIQHRQRVIRALISRSAPN